jgi:hypothetical protein
MHIDTDHRYLVNFRSFALQTLNSSETNADRATKKNIKNRAWQEQSNALYIIILSCTVDLLEISKVFDLFDL